MNWVDYELAMAEWRRDSKYLSGGFERHPSFERVTKAGGAVMTYLGQDVLAGPGWMPLVALAGITGICPTAENQGRYGMIVMEWRARYIAALRFLAAPFIH